MLLTGKNQFQATFSNSSVESCFNSEPETQLEATGRKLVGDEIARNRKITDLLYYFTGKDRISQNKIIVGTPKGHRSCNVTYNYSTESERENSYKTEETAQLQGIIKKWRVAF